MTCRNHFGEVNQLPKGFLHAVVVQQDTADEIHKATEQLHLQASTEQLHLQARCWVGYDSGLRKGMVKLHSDFFFVQ